MSKEIIQGANNTDTDVRGAHKPSIIMNQTTKEENQHPRKSDDEKIRKLSWRNEARTQQGLELAKVSREIEPLRSMAPRATFLLHELGVSGKTQLCMGGKCSGNFCFHELN